MEDNKGLVGNCEYYNNTGDLTLREYQLQAVSTAIYPGKGTAIGLAYVALKMNGEAGEFAEHVGKAIRDDNLLTDPGKTDHFLAGGELTKARRVLLLKEVGDVLWYLAAAAEELGVNLNTIAQMNIAKLADRQSRGVLGGSGDNR